MTVPLVLALTTTLLAVPPAGAAAVRPGHHKVWQPPNRPLPLTTSVPVAKTGKRTAVRPPRPVPPRAPHAAALPRLTRLTATARTAGPGAPARAGALPVWVAPGAKAARGAAPLVTVVRNDTGTARAAGVDGLLFSLTATTGTSSTPSGKGVPVTVGIDPAALQQATGGAFAARGRLVLLPSCAATTPKLPACRVGKPLTMRQDKATGRVTAELVMPLAAAPAAGTASRTAATSPAPAPLLLAADTEESGGGGDYKATALAPSSSWAAGGSSGALTYSYPLTLPPALGGQAPALALGYDSSSVDGRTSATNAQASWIGDGWDLNPGFVERTYKACDDAGIDGSGDLCWAGYNASLSLGQHSGPLVRVSSGSAATDADTGVWRLKNDDGTRVEFGSGAANGVRDGAYAKVTDPAGTTYYFGVNHLPGGDKTDPATDSVSSVPVYAPKSGDPCHDDAQGAASWCRMWQRLSLDHVVDPHGNLTTYRWAPETNHYARGGGQNHGSGTLEPYTRATTLASVSYGQRLDEQIAAKGALQPAARVTFTTAERCNDQNTCDPAQRTVANKANWPDVPVDRECSPGGAACTAFGPTYFTTKRLASVLTEVRTGGSWKAVDAYELKHSFPDPKDASDQKALWLDSVQRTGKAGAPDAPLPAVTFTPVMLPNRVDGTALVPAPPRMNRPRIQQIANETGGVLNVDYDLPGCSRINNVMPTAEDDNAKACYPVRWTVPGAVIGSDPVLDWFNHYTVKSITENDTATDAPQKITSYSYDKPGWHRDDSQFTDAKARTWGEFRGFATVTAVTGSGGDGPKSQVRTSYLQGMNGDVRKDGSTRAAQFTDALGRTVTDQDWLGGRVLQTETFDQAGGAVTSHTVNAAAGEQETARQPRGAGLPDLVARYAATTTTATASSKKADGTWWKTAKTTVTDPGHGNRPKWVLDQADGLPDLCTRSTYADGPDPVRTNLVAETLTVSGAAACTADPVAGNTTSRSRVLYDGKPFGQSGPVGDPTTTQVLEKYAADGTPEFTDTAVTTYDAYGRVLTATDPTATDAQHPAGALTRTTYDPATGEAPTTRTVSAPVPGQAPTVTWDTVTTLDPRRGLTLTERDPNGRTGTTGYDALGRLTAVWRPGRTPAANPQADLTYEYAVSKTTRVPTAVTTSTLMSDAGEPVRMLSVALLDGFGRPRQTQATPPNPDYPGRLITDTVYDSQGRVRLENAAWYNQASGPVGTLAPAAESTIPTQTRTAYDGQGRKTVVAAWSLGVEQNRTTTSYPGSDRTDTVPPTGSWPGSVVTDARGRATARWQYRTPTVTGNAADATVSTYTYTADGKPLTRKDAAGNTWSFGYDARGRQTSGTDPDTGTATQGYDKASHLVSSKDGRGTTLLRTYDLLGRQTGLYDGTVTGAKQLAGWTYDTVTGGKGKPASATRYTGGTGGQAYTSAVTGYDNAYRTTGTKVTLPGSEIGQTGTYSYTVTSTFDRLTGKRLTQRVPPAGGLPLDDLAYWYDQHGEMYTFAGAATYDTETDYDAFGRPIRSTVNPYGSQVVTTLDYDQGSGRLRNQYLDKQTSQSGAVQQTSYTYDKAGHLTSVTNTPDNDPAKRDRECFTRDHLGRLTAAWTDTGALTPPGQGQTLDQGGCANATPTAGATAPALTTVGGGAPYWHEFSYDVTGNRRTFVNHDLAGDTAKDVTTTQGFPAGGTVNAGAGAGGPHALGATTTKTGTTTSTSGSHKYDGAGNPVSEYTSKTGTTLMTWTPDGKIESRTPAVPVTGIGGKCLDMQGGSSAAGTPAQIYTCNSGGGQRFALTGSLLKVFDKCVTAMGTAAGSLVQLQSCDGGAAQTWTRRADGTLYNPAATRCLAVPGDVTTNGTDLVVADCGSTVPAGQKWAATDKVTSYLYDADGNTVVRRSPGKNVVDLGDTELVYDTVAKTLTGTRTYTVPGGLTMVRTGSALTVQLADHHGSGVLTLDLGSTGLDEARRLMDPFGNPRGSQPAAGVWAGQQGFVGGTKDDGTGLTTLGARQYEPATGRFLSTDPVIDPDDPQQWNGYVYSGNSPVDGSDPSGLFCDGCSANNPDSVWNDHGPGCTNEACYYDNGQKAYDVLPPGGGKHPGRNGRDPSANTHLNRKDNVGDYKSREADQWDRQARLHLQMLKLDFAAAFLSMSADLTQHYLDGTGEDYYLAPDDVDDLLRSSGIRQPLDAYVDQVYTELKDSQERTSFDSMWMQDAAADTSSPDWFLGLRNIEYRVSGTIEKGQMTYSVQVYKNYNFDIGESFMGVDFGPFAKLHEAGLAREYDIVGTSSQKYWDGQWDGQEQGLVYVGGL